MLTIIEHILIALSVFHCVSSQECTQSSVRICLKAFDGSQVLYLVSPLDADLPSWNESLAELKDRCLRYRRYSSCISTVIPNCNPSDKDYLTGLDEAYKFLCDSSNNLTDFIQYEKCYEQDGVMLGEKFCNETFVSKLASIEFTVSDQDTLQKYCTYTDNYLTCLTDTVSGNCDDFSAAWQKIWNRKKRQQRMWNTLNCPNWNDESDTAATIWTIVLSVVLGLTTLIMIVGILIILLFINRKKKTRRRSAMPPPPPYTSDPSMMYDGAASPNSQEEGTEPTVSLPAQPSSATGEVSGAVGITMRPAVRHPIKPPPYMGQEAPAYEEAEECSGSAVPGNTNSGFEEEEDVCDKEEDACRVSVGGHQSAPPVTTTSGVTDSERELNTDRF